MKTFRPEQVFRPTLIAIQCDRCDREISILDSESEMEAQEWIRIEGTGGYASRFWGDGNHWIVDLCEACQAELFRAISRPPRFADSK